MKKSFFAEVRVFKNELWQDYDKDIPAEPSERLMNFLEKQILFLQEKLTNKNKLLSSCQLSKNRDKISSSQQQHAYTGRNDILRQEEETESTSATKKHYKTNIVVTIKGNDINALINTSFADIDITSQEPDKIITNIL